MGEIPWDTGARVGSGAAREAALERRTEAEVFGVRPGGASLEAALLLLALPMSPDAPFLLPALSFARVGKLSRPLGCVGRRRFPERKNCCRSSSTRIEAETFDKHDVCRKYLHLSAVPLRVIVLGIRRASA